MGKPFYADYAEHALRYYSRFCTPTTMPRDCSAVDRANIDACQAALAGIPVNERALIVNLHRMRDRMPNNVRAVSGQTGIPEDDIWLLVKRVNRDVALHRGLVSPTQR